MRKTAIFWLGIGLIMQATAVRAGSDWTPPFPAPSGDVACALSFKPPAVPGNTADTLKKDWDDLSICGKNDASWSTLDCGSVCRVKLKDLRPTQSSVGTAAVNCKARKMEQKIKDEGDYEKYFKKEKRLVPVIIGPNEKFYVLDHHHMSNALYRADLNIDGKRKDREVLAVVLFNTTQDYLEKNDLSTLDQGQFEAGLDSTAKRVDGQAVLCTDTAAGKGVSMPGIGMFWPCDKNGKTISFSEMSHQDGKVRKIYDLDDDPLRSMSRWVRNAYGYVKCKEDDEHVTAYCEDNPGAKGNPANFMEFQWANYMRTGFAQRDPAALTDLTTRIQPGKGQLAAISRYLPEALGMTLDPKAQQMIGYNNQAQVAPWAYPTATFSEDACDMDDSLQELIETMGYED